MIERNPVSSSNIKSIGHDPETKTLAVEFNDGTVYHYHDVDKDVHDALVGAKSVGRQFHAAIKGCFKFTKQ